MNLKVINTLDGSKTLQLPEWSEQYHSTHGAISEAQHVYIENGLNAVTKKSITIFEMGFGTGLNVFMTYLDNLKYDRQITYYSMDVNPLPLELIKKLDHLSQLNAHNFQSVFTRIHTCKWNDFLSISDNFQLYKIHNSIEKHSFNTTFDLVYYDAFGPRVQAELWTKDILMKIVNSINTDGVLVTYCAKGEVKRILKSLGMSVESLAGPPGKREMIRAIKTKINV